MFQKDIEFSFLLRKINPSNKIGKVLLALFYGFMFIGCANLFGLQGIFIAISIVSFFIYLILFSKIHIDFYSIFCLTFFVFYSLGYTIYQGIQINVIFYSLFPLIFQQFCFAFKDKKKLIWLLILDISIGLFISFIFSLSSTIWYQGLNFNGGYLTYFWGKNGDSIFNRTGLSLYVLGATSIAFSLLVTKSRFRTKFSIPLFVIILILAVASGIIAANRSFVVAFVLLAFIYLLYFLCVTTKPKYMYIALAIIIIPIVLYFLFITGIIPLPSFLSKIYIVRRFLDPAYNSNSGRINHYKTFFTTFYKYPLGGMSRIDGFTFVHNALLDFYSYGGVVPFLVMCGFTVHLFILLIRYLKSTNVGRLEKALLLNYITAIMSLGLFEPIYQANQNCFSPLFIIYFYLLYNCDQASIEDEIAQEKNIQIKEEEYYEIEI